tara:strand:+ start:2957 stop:3385 length:429 start_codon:yes stop_codon:yes gene_type:complete
VLRTVAEVPGTVVHELVQVQQRVKGQEGQSLLARSVREGVAVYVTELVTGRDTQTAPMGYGRLHEAALWEKFQSVIGGNDASAWLSNGTSAVDRPAELGYFIGSQICKAYARRVGKRDETIRSFLEAEDLVAIYRESGYGPR